MELSQIEQLALGRSLLLQVRSQAAISARFSAAIPILRYSCVRTKIILASCVKKESESCVRAMIIFCVAYMMSANNEEKTRQIRGAKNPGEHFPHPDRDQFAGSKSHTIGFESLGTGGNDSPTRGGVNPGRKAVFGKMLSHLISDYRNQVATKKQEITLISAKLRELEQLQDELINSDDE